jgi:cystathionine beta-lyase
MQESLHTHLPEVDIVVPEGTYLVWVDFNRLGISSRDLKAKLFQEARVYLDDGDMFGPEGTGFARFNIACPRSILAEALERIAGVLGPFTSPGPSSS